MRGVALDGLNEVRHKVVPSLQLNVDARPRLVDAVARPDDRVADQDKSQPDQQQDRDDDDGYNHSVRPLLRSVWWPGCEVFLLDGVGVCREDRQTSKRRLDQVLGELRSPDGVQ